LRINEILEILKDELLELNEKKKLIEAILIIFKESLAIIGGFLTRRKRRGKWC
jgi:hypothetical protein